MTRTNQSTQPRPTKTIPLIFPSSISRSPTIKLQTHPPTLPILPSRPAEARMRGGVANHPLRKQHSWSPDIERDEAWTRRKDLFRRGGREGRSLTDDDLDELRGCIDLGFGFDMASVEGAKKLTRSFPALDLYYAVHKGHTACCGSSLGEASGGSSPMSIVSPGDTPELVKTRLKQWAQVVACAIRQQY